MALVTLDKAPQMSQAQIVVRGAENPAELAETLEHQGRVVAKTYPRLARFAEVLAHPAFAEFFEQNFSTWDDCEQSIMLLKMGAHMKTVVAQSTGEEVSGHQLAAAMDQVMHQPDTRQYMVKSLKEFMQQQQHSPRKLLPDVQ